MHRNALIQSSNKARAKFDKFSRTSYNNEIALAKGGSLMKEEMKNKLKAYFSNGPKVIFIALLLICGIVVGMQSTKKTVTVSIDGNEKTIVTYNNTFKKALASNKIVVGPKDKTAPSLDSRVNNGDKIYIKKAVDIQLAVDGQTLDIQSAENNVNDMFKAENIVVDEFDKVFPSRESTLEKGLKIAVTRVKIDYLTQKKILDFTTVVKPDDDSEKGNIKILQEGQQGEEEIVTKIVYEDGKEVARKIVSDVIKKDPVTKIVASGTLGVVPNLSRGGSKVLYKKSLRVKATAYSAGEDGGTRTASGTSTKRNPNGYSTIAVDPDVIPLGTRVYIPGYGYAIAEDTGGAINGNIIDVYFNSSSEMSRWGVKYLTIYILK